MYVISAKSRREERTREKRKYITGYKFDFKINIQQKYRLDFCISGHRHVVGCFKECNTVSFHQFLRMLLLCSVTGSIRRWTSLQKGFLERAEIAVTYKLHKLVIS